MNRLYHISLKVQVPGEAATALSPSVVPVLGFHIDFYSINNDYRIALPGDARHSMRRWLVQVDVPGLRAQIQPDDLCSHHGAPSCAGIYEVGSDQPVP